MKGALVADHAWLSIPPFNDEHFMGDPQRMGQRKKAKEGKKGNEGEERQQMDAGL